jgi:adenine-specific DNA-methyltransferase
MPRDSTERLIAKRRVQATGVTLNYVRYFDDFPYRTLSNLWDGLGGAPNPIFVVQTNPEVVQRCVLMTTDPGDLVLDPTCGSGTTAFVAEQWGRRWITCDTSRVALTLAKQRLMTAVYPYYRLAHPDQGVSSGFEYRTAGHASPSNIANDEPPVLETLYDQPGIDRSRVRVSGPFTSEAVPAPVVGPVDEVAEDSANDASIARTGPTLRQAEWRAHIQRAGIRGRAGAKIEFSRVEPQGGTRYLNAAAETKDAKPQTVAISFGPEHAPLEQRQVELAWEEARGLSPRPDILVFAAFQFDPEAAKDIDELDPKKTGMTFLRVQMDPDLLVDDLRKKSAGDHSFWLIGQPDVRLRRGDAGRYVVEVAGFDYYDPRTGAIDSGDTSKIAMWLLDTDYDGRSLLPRQVFFPMAGDNDGWSKLAKDLRAIVDETLLEAYRGTTSLAFEAGVHKRAAVKIVDDRGIESLKLLELG